MWGLFKKISVMRVDVLIKIITVLSGTFLEF